MHFNLMEYRKVTDVVSESMLQRTFKSNRLHSFGVTTKKNIHHSY